jgi:hypothetical protein
MDDVGAVDPVIKRQNHAVNRAPPAGYSSVKGENLIAVVLAVSFS